MRSKITLSPIIVTHGSQFASVSTFLEALSRGVREYLTSELELLKSVLSYYTTFPPVSEDPRWLNFDSFRDPEGAPKVKVSLSEC